jgi:hypothetical protein
MLAGAALRSSRHEACELPRHRTPSEMLQNERSLMRVFLQRLAALPEDTIASLSGA